VDLTPELADALKAIKHGGERLFCQESGSMLLPGHFHEVLWAAQRRASANQVARAAALVRGTRTSPTATAARICTCCRPRCPRAVATRWQQRWRDRA